MLVAKGTAPAGPWGLRCKRIAAAIRKTKASTIDARYFGLPGKKSAAKSGTLDQTGIFDYIRYLMIATTRELKWIFLAALILPSTGVVAAMKMKEKEQVEQSKQHIKMTAIILDYKEGAMHDYMKGTSDIFYASFKLKILAPKKYFNRELTVYEEMPISPGAILRKTGREISFNVTPATLRQEVIYTGALNELKLEPQRSNK